MNRRQKIIVSVTGIFLVLLILVGLTYAYFLTQIQGNEEEKSITVTTANLVLEYGDGNGILETDKLEPSNDFINFKDNQGNLVPSKIFTVTNKGNATVEGYKVYLENVQNQLERKDDLVYTLSCTPYINYGEEGQAVSGECTGVSTETTFPDVITSIVSNDIAVGITHVYELKAKYKEMNVDQSIDMNKLITAKINIYDASTKFLAREIMDNAISTATVTYNKTLYIDPSLQDGINYTIPGEQINEENERIITYTMDDYGTSYYFRGNVEDNYVNFAGMCWRVVRIEGDGSIKLILEDQDQLCNSKDTDGNLNMDGNWKMGEGNYGYESKNVDSDYIVESVMNYLKPVSSNTSSMVKAFYDFQITKIADYTGKLKSGDWCLGDKAYTRSGLLGSYTYTLLEENNYSSNMYYDAYTRLVSGNVNGYQPTLKCNGTVLNEFADVSGVSSKAPMYVSAITADEIVFAGIKYEESNFKYYLLNNYQESNYFSFWSLSFFGFNGTDSYGLFVDGSGSLCEGDVGVDSPFRPLISLASSAVISDGNGTLKSPYIIN